MRQKTEGSLIVLNRSVVIGIIVLVTTVSFTFGYFVGRFSKKQENAQPPAERSEVISQVQSEQKTEGTDIQKTQVSTGKGQSIDEKIPDTGTKQPEPGQSQDSAGKKEPDDNQPKTTIESRKEAVFKKGAYYLQVGAFKEEGRAKTLGEHFKKEHYDVIIKKEQALYRVYLGTFRTKKEALLAQTRVRKLYKIEPVIIKK